MLTYLVPAAVIAFLVFAWLSDRKSEQRQARQLAEADEHRTSEEYVAKQQVSFEERLAQGVEIRLPDALTGEQIYIYRRLMREWFDKLVAQNRYNEPTVVKLRKDWLVYMELLESRQTNEFLSLEASDEAKRPQYGREAHEEGMQITAIENGFAEAVGPEAVDALRQTRAKRYDDFSNAGELAPEGYRYRGFSLRGVPDQPIPRQHT
jgi:hypothetical protein